MTSQRSSLAGYLIPRLQDVVFAAIFLGVIALGPRVFNLVRRGSSTPPKRLDRRSPT